MLMLARLLMLDVDYFITAYDYHAAAIFAYALIISLMPMSLL